MQNVHYKYELGHSSRILQSLKMFSLKSDNFYDAVKLLHACSKLIGLTSFTIKKENGIFVESVTVFNLSCILFSTLWTIFVSIFFVYKADDIWNVNLFYISEVFKKSMYSVTLSFFLVLIISNWWIFFSRKSLNLLINKLVDIDDELSEMKVSVNLKKQKLFIIFFVFIIKFLTCLSVFLANFLAKNISVQRFNVLLMITMFIFIEIWIFVNSQFIFLMWSVKLRFKMINLFLRKNFFELQNDMIEDGNRKIKKTAVLHEKIVDVSEAINRCYRVPVSKNVQ